MGKTAVIKLAGIDLYFDFSLITYDYCPILFIANGSDGHLYLCHCSEVRFGIRWNVSRTTYHIVQRLIEQQISIVEALRLGSKVFVSTYKHNEGFKSQVVEFDEIDELDLPDADLYLDYPDEGVEEALIKRISKETLR